MAETLRELTVSLSLNGDNFSRNLRSINQQIKEAESEFNLAAAGVGEFGKKSDETAAKIEALKKKQEMQNAAIEQYTKALEEANTSYAKAKADIGEYGAKLEQAREKQAALKGEVDKAKAALEAAKKTYGENSDAVAQMEKKLEELTEEYKASGDEVKTLEGKVTASQNAMMRQQDAASKSQTALNGVKKEAAETAKQIDKLGDRLANAAEKTEKFAKGMVKVGEGATKAGKTLSMTVTAPIVAIGTAAVSAAIEFESAFTGVRKTVDATEERFAELEQAVRDMSLEVPSTTTVIAGVMEIAGQLGIATETLESYTRTMIDISETTNLSAEDAATAIAQFSNITGMAQSEAQNFGSSLIALGNNFATTEADIMKMATRLAAAGSQVGLSESQILGFATALSSVGIQAEAGGTAFSKVMTKMQVAVETNSGDLKEFAKVSGMTSKEFKQAWQEDAAGAIQAFIVGLSNMSEEGISAIAVLEDMDLTEVRLRDTLLRATNASELFAKAQTMAADAWEENTALANEAALRYDTVASQLQMLKNKVSIASQSLGTELMPMFRGCMEAVSSLIDWFMALDTSLKEQIIWWAAIAAAVGPALMLFGKITTGAGKTVQAVLWITKALGKLSLVQWGWIGVAVAGVTALGVAIKAIMDEWDAGSRRMSDINARIVESNSEMMDSFNQGAKTYTADVNVDVEITEGYSQEASKLYDDIFEWLTDGMPDTKEQKEEVERLVNEYFGQLVSDVKIDEEGRLASLKAQFEGGFIDEATYIKRCAEVRAESAATMNQLETLREDTMKFVENYAGAPRAVVQEAYGEIDALEARVQELLGSVQALNQAYATTGERAAMLVKAGATDDMKTVGLGFEYTYQQFVIDEEKVRLKAEEAKKQVDEIWEAAFKDAEKRGDEEGIERANAARESEYRKIDEETKAELAALGYEYNAEIARLFDGLEKRFPEETRKLINLLAMPDVIKEAREALFSDSGIGELSLSNLGFDFDAMSKELKEALDFDALLEESGGDKDILNELVRNRLTEMTSTLNVDAVEYQAQIEAALSDSGLGAALYAAIENGYLEGIEGFDKLNGEDILKMVLGEFKTPITEEVIKGMMGGTEGNSSSMMSAADEGAKAAFNAVTGSLSSNAESFKGDIQSSLFSPFNALDSTEAQENAKAAYTQIMSAAGDGITEGVAAEAEKARKAGAAMGNGMEDGARSALQTNSPSKVFKSIGADAVNGMILGVQSRQSALRAAMVSAAREAVKAAKQALDIKSPSRVFRDEVGAMMAEGMGVGFAEESKRQSRIIANAMRYTTEGAQRAAIYGAQRITNDSRNQSTNINIAKVEARTDRDIENLALEMDALRRKRQRGYGYR